MLAFPCHLRTLRWSGVGHPADFPTWTQPIRVPRPQYPVSDYPDNRFLLVERANWPPRPDARHQKPVPRTFRGREATAGRALLPVPNRSINRSHQHRATSGGRRSAIRSRMRANSSRGTATSASNGNGSPCSPDGKRRPREQAPTRRRCSWTPPREVGDQLLACPIHLANRHGEHLRPISVAVAELAALEPFDRRSCAGRNQGINRRRIKGSRSGAAAHDTDEKAVGLDGEARAAVVENH